MSTPRHITLDADEYRLLEQDSVELIQLFERLASVARREGLIALEDHAQSLPLDILQEGIQEVVDGTPRATLVQFLQSRAQELDERLDRRRKRAQLLMRLIETGLVGLQSGHAPRLLRIMLAAHLSPEDRSRLAEAVQARYTSQVPPPAAAGRGPSPGISKDELNTLTFEDLLKLSDRDIQRLARSIDSKDMALALRGASADVRNKILRGYSRRAAAALLETMDEMGPQRAGLVEEGQRKVLAVARRLVEVGEIGVATN